MGKTRDEMMVDLHAWITALSGVLRGRITLSNFRYDYRHSRIPNPIVTAFLVRVCDAWAERPLVRKTGAKAPRPDEIWQSIAREFSLVGPPVGKGLRRCSRVMVAADLIANNIDPEECVPIQPYPSETEIAYLKHRWDAGIATGTMRGTNPFAWVTKTPALQRARKKPNPADHARLILGLFHWKEDERLLEIRYPAKCFTVDDLRLPTSLEGCPSLIFRSRTAPDGWGRTVRLDTLKDGAPEALHRELPFTQAFQIEDLGVLGPLRLKRDVWRSWDAVVSALPDAWTVDAIDELEPYV